jgi:hypothetical protein
MLVDRPAVRAAARRTLEFTLEFGARFNEPPISQRDQEHWIDLGINHILASGDEAECADTAAQDRDGFVFRNLCTTSERREKTQSHGEQDDTSPEHMRAFSN